MYSVALTWERGIVTYWGMDENKPDPFIVMLYGLGAICACALIVLVATLIISIATSGLVPAGTYDKNPNRKCNSSCWLF